MGRPTTEMIRIANRLDARMERGGGPTGKKNGGRKKHGSGNRGDRLVKVGRDSPEWERILKILDSANSKGLNASKRKQILNAIEKGVPIPNQILRGFNQGIQREIKAIQRGEWTPGMHLEEVMHK